MKRNQTIQSAALTLLLTAMLTACMAGKRVDTTAAEPTTVTGTYTLLLYGCHYPAEVDNVAILVAENSKYPLEIYDLDTSYRVKKGVPAQQALTEADSFVRCSTYRIWQTQLRRIPDGSGGTVGYELRPLYLPYEFGFPDVLLISYFLRDGKVRAYIKIDPGVERALEASGGNDSSRDNK